VPVARMNDVGIPTRHNGWSRMAENTAKGAERQSIQSSILVDRKGWGQPPSRPLGAAFLLAEVLLGAQRDLK
jgi:hypothetical protein